MYSTEQRVTKKVMDSNKEDIMSTLPSIIIAGVISYILSRVLGIHKGDQLLWITSPSGKTDKQLPLYTALRVIRKQGYRQEDYISCKIYRI